MSYIIESILRDICLDERIHDGIFRMENENHMNVLRDYFVKRGITQEAAVSITNRMLEGKYPERQAYRKEDGILVTFPTPQHKSKAMSKNPGKYTDKDPKPPKKEDPGETEDFLKKDLPPSQNNNDNSKDIPPENGEDDKEEDNNDDNNIGKSLPKSSFSGGGNDSDDTGDKEPTIFQGNRQLEIEPPRGDEKPEPIPPSPTVPVAPRTPERIGAEKEVARQIIATDNSNLTNIDTPININENLNELFDKVKLLGLNRVTEILKSYTK